MKVIIAVIAVVFSLGGCEWVAADIVGVTGCDKNSVCPQIGKTEQQMRKRCLYGKSVFCLIRPQQPKLSAPCDGDDFPCKWKGKS